MYLPMGFSLGQNCLAVDALTRATLSRILIVDKGTRCPAASSSRVAHDESTATPSPEATACLIASELGDFHHSLELFQPLAKQTLRPGARARSLLPEQQRASPQMFRLHLFDTAECVTRCGDQLQTVRADLYALQTFCNIHPKPSILRAANCWRPAICS
jgi:hypothetical protein